MVLPYSNNILQSMLNYIEFYVIKDSIGFKGRT